MIQSLLEYGRQQGLVSTPGYGTEGVRFFLDFSQDGARFLGLSPATEDGKGVRTFRDIPRLSAEEKKGKLLLGRAADFLLAPLGEIFGLDDKGAPDEGKARRAAFFRECLTEAAEFMPVLGEVAAALALPEAREKALADAVDLKAKWTDKATIRLGAGFPIGKPDWKPWWDEFRLRVNGPAPTGEGTMVSFATGELVTPVSVHEKFRKWTAIGGSAFGEPLIAFDKEAFASYGLEQGENAAMEAKSVAAYAGALRSLAERNVLLAGSYFVSWYTGPTESVQAIEAESDDFFDLLESASPEPVDPVQANARLKAAMARVKTARGDGGGLDGLRFAVLNFSVAPGRVMVRDHVEGSVLALNDAADLWFDHLNVVDALGRPAELPTLARLVECPLPPRSPDTDAKRWSAPAVAWARGVWRAAITGAPIPRAAFDRALDAHRRLMVVEGLQSTVSQKGELTSLARLTARRMALLKAYLRRKDIPMTPALDPEHPQPAYHCGRLIALYEGLQKAAHKKRHGREVNTGVVDRFYAGTTTNPRLALTQLSKLSMTHLSMLGGGLANQYEAEIARVNDAIQGSYPNNFTSEEQALFTLGYWHQIAERNRQIAEAKAKKAATANDEQDTEDF